MRRRRRGLLWAIGLCVAILAAAPSARACGTALVLAVDVSSSVDHDEYDLQTKGLGAALRAPEVIDAILGSGGAMVMVVYWSGYPHQEVRVPWTRLEDRAAIVQLSRRLETLNRRYLDFPTALGKALELVATVWTPETDACGRRVVDVSGDGVSNSGPRPGAARDALVAQGATINGLVIKGADPDPEPFYRDEVIGGPGAFIEVANGYDDYARAIRRKLFLELSAPYAEQDDGGGVELARTQTEPAP